ncbi:hypothetical protein D3C71_1177290 [compost metagenome]
MPQSNQRVSRFDIVSDLRSYYRGSVVSLESKGKIVPVYVEDYASDDGEVKATIRHLNTSHTEWASRAVVPNEALSYILPPLGLVKYGNYWFHLTRHPARRMRKGYNDECVGWHPVGDHSQGLDIGVSDPKIVSQVWYGNEDRITHNIVVVGGKIYYTTDHVANVTDEGEVTLIPEREKLGEFVCKALANNWESVISKTSVRTLPSSVPTP